MTIREHFRRLNHRGRYVTVGAVILLALVLLCIFPLATRSTDLKSTFLLGGAALLCLQYLFERKYVSHCPRCSADLQKLYKKERPFIDFDPKPFWERWDKCPQCGVRFDAEYGPISG
jgi:hypothetical protein